MARKNELKDRKMLSEEKHERKTREIKKKIVKRENKILSYFSSASLYLALFWKIFKNYNYGESLVNFSLMWFSKIKYENWSTTFSILIRTFCIGVDRWLYWQCSKFPCTTCPIIPSLIPDPSINGLWTIRFSNLKINGRCCIDNSVRTPLYRHCPLLHLRIVQKVGSLYSRLHRITAHFSQRT